MRHFVLGFAFTEDEKMLLILKNPTRGPEEIRGLWNGLGGHVKEKEDDFEAMSREFKEECDVEIAPRRWKKTVAFTMKTHSRVQCFSVILTHKELIQAKTMGDEPVGFFIVHPINSVPNLDWLIPMHKQAERFNGGEIYLDS